MCTLSYIPYNTGGFILTSNRDESVLREPALPPAVYPHQAFEVLYPKDPKGGGTWLASSSNQFTLCLLNGAFEKHIQHPPYRQSRGLVVTGFFDYNNVNDFVRDYSFTCIEPFTLIIIQHQLQLTIYELRWNGETVFMKIIDGTKPQIWSSVTLYEPEVIAARQNWFDDFLAVNAQPTLHDMLHFHHFGGVGNSATNILMNRDHILRTVSITAVTVSETETCMFHEDLIAEKQTERSLIHVVSNGGE